MYTARPPVTPLSPRMRGNHPLVHRAAPRNPSIPAYAGEPPTAPTRGRPSSLYPRVCGGTSRQPPLAIRGRPLSPRMRGNQGYTILATPNVTSIPAYAGEPTRAATGPPQSRLYPRVCGGTAVCAGSDTPGGPLSPRMRGNPQRAKLPPSTSRSIPACAGEPYMRKTKKQRKEVYPRVCGGTESGRFGAMSSAGLSPRVRGNLYDCVDMRRPLRSIPACAGEPWKGSWIGWNGSVYPRVCGGTFITNWPAQGTPGLSPRVRGNPPASPSGFYTQRSIPACAGEPREVVGRQVRQKVYPRVCGGTPYGVLPRSCVGGLSPRVRGNPGASRQ